jgi:hypothetical protein
MPEWAASLQRADTPLAAIEAAALRARKLRRVNRLSGIDVWSLPSQPTRTIPLGAQSNPKGTVESGFPR